jgi:hypothetical protein
MHVTQDLNSFGEIIAHVQCSADEKKLKYIPCVPHKNNCPKKIGSHDMKQTDSSIIIVRNVCVLTSASMIVYLFFTRSWSAIIRPKLFTVLLNICTKFKTTYAISAYHHGCCEFESRSARGVQHYVIKFVSDLQQVSVYFLVLRFPPPIKLTATI